MVRVELAKPQPTVSWLLLLLLLLCAPAFFFAAVGLSLGAATLALGFIAIWATLFALLAAIGIETGIASLTALVLALPAGWIMLDWVPEVNSG